MKGIERKIDEFLEKYPKRQVNVLMRFYHIFIGWLLIRRGVIKI
jgi:hypothetical protein